MNSLERQILRFERPQKVRSDLKINMIFPNLKLDLNLKAQISPQNPHFSQFNLELPKPFLKLNIH